MINVETCRHAVADHTPFDAAEDASIEKTLRFLDAHERFWQRDNHAGHLTASAWIVNEARSHVLLTHHKKLNRWLQLGGHIDAEDGSLLAAALREGREESGIATLEPVVGGVFDVDCHPILTAKEPTHVHYDIRYLLVAQDMEFAVSDESHALRWFALDEVPTIDNATTLIRMTRKIGKGRRVN